MAKNYYTILDVDSDATQDQIKSAYRKKAKKLHPDRSGQNSAPFRAVQEAYEVLSDPERRRSYDAQLAHERCVRIRPGGTYAEPLSARRRPVEPLIPTQGRIDLGDVFDQPFQSFDSPLAEILDRLWSELSGLAWPKSKRIKDIDVEIPLTPDQALHGGRARVVIPVRVECPACWGYGRVGFYACPHCSGMGTIREAYPVWIDFPAGTLDGDTIRIPLDRLGVHDLYLTVHFRVGRMP